MAEPDRRRLAVLGVALVVVCGSVIGAVGVPGVGRALPSAENVVNQVHIAVSASASMNEPLGSAGSKADVTRRAVGDVTGTLPDDAQVGLRSYGGCARSDLLKPISRSGPFDSTPQIGAPTGQSRPVAHALTEAARDFATLGRRTIVLIADGDDTCGEDPVTVARQLATGPAPVCVDVIGVGVTDAARRQLTRVALAACGDYFQAYDAATFSAQLRRVSLRALQPVRPVATVISGTDQPFTAPTLIPGRYTDVMPPDTPGDAPRRWYRATLPVGTTAHFSATVALTAPLSAAVTGKLELTLRTSDNTVCGSDIGFRLSNGGTTSVTAAVTVTTRRDAVAGTCGAPGEYRLELGNAGDQVRATLAPLQLLVLIEPPVRSTSKLPGPVRASGQFAAPDVAGSVTAVTGGGSYDSAPVVGTGRYSDTVAPGERVTYRVPLAYGQQLVTRLVLPELPTVVREKLGYGTSVELELSNPLYAPTGQGVSTRIGFYTGEGQGLLNSTPAVRYRNRDADDDLVRAASVAGYYYVSVYLKPDPVAPEFVLPIQLELAIDGERRGVPSYRFTSQLLDPASQLSVSTPGGLPTLDRRAGGVTDVVAVVGIVIGAVLTVGGGVSTAVILRRRVRRGQREFSSVAS